MSKCLLFSFIKFSSSELGPESDEVLESESVSESESPDHEMELKLAS